MWHAENNYRQTSNASKIQSVWFATLIWKWISKGATFVLALFISAVSKWRRKKPHNRANVSSIHNFRYLYRQRVCLCCVISDLINGWRSLSDDSVSLAISYLTSDSFLRYFQGSPSKTILTGQITWKQQELRPTILSTLNLYQVFAGRGKVEYFESVSWNQLKHNTLNYGT